MSLHSLYRGLYHRSRHLTVAFCVFLVVALWGLALERVSHEREAARALAGLIPWHDPVAEFNDRALHYYALAAVGTLLLVLFGVVLVRQLAREAAALSRNQAQLRALEEISLAPGFERGDIDALAPLVTETASRLLGAARANLWLFDARETELRCIDLFEAPARRHSRGMVLKEAQFRNEFEALKRASYVAASDPLTDPRTRGYVDAYLRPLGITSMLDVVIGASGRHLGLLCIEHVGPRHRWDQDEISFACRLAEKFAAALANRAARASEERFRDLANNTNDFIWELDERFRFTFASGSLRSLLGAAPERVLGYTPAQFMPEDERARIVAQFEEIAAARQPFSGIEHTVLDASGGRHTWEVSGVPILGADGSLRGYRGVSRDVTARKRAEAELLRAAHFDRTTGLPNRALCFDRLKQAIAQAGRQGSFTGLLLLDMDRFKNINDMLGHPGGDGVLRATAERLAQCVRSGDTVARIGGDEFAIVLHLLHRPDDAAVVAKKILAAMGHPVLEGGQEIFAGASIGIAICPPDGAAPEALLRNADAALLQAKKAGRGTFQFYTAEMNTRAAERLALERDLRKALERGEFLLHYQPKVRIATGEVAGFEALLRWRRPGAERPMSPAEFVPVLEESGFIREVGAWAVGEACRQLRAWRDAGHRLVPVSVNVAAKQFNVEFPGIVRAALQRHGVEAGLLTVEITESDAMVDPERALKVLDELRALGVAVSIDDFGTGYSSLGYLKRFQPSELKIDRSFVAGLPEDADNVSITRAVISMAHSLGMHVVAEGVETAAQCGFLQHHGCEQMQGYLFSRPLPAAACVEYLRPALPAVEAA